MGESIAEVAADEWRCPECGFLACICFDDDEQPDDEDAYLDECGMMADGCCTLAGTEFCDWDCPRNRPTHQGADHDR